MQIITNIKEIEAWADPDRPAAEASWVADPFGAAPVIVIRPEDHAAAVRKEGISPLDRMIHSLDRWRGGGHPDDSVFERVTKARMVKEITKQARLLAKSGDLEYPNLFNLAMVRLSCNAYLTKKVDLGNFLPVVNEKNLAEARCISYGSSFEGIFYKHFSAVLPLSRHVSADDYMRSFIGRAIETSLHDFSAYTRPFHILTLWHEFSHAATTDEPNADLMAGLVARRNTQDISPVMLKSDLRLADVILYTGSDREEIWAKYGWPMVEVNDRVATLPQQQIDDMSMVDIVKHKDLKFDHAVVDTQAVVNGIEARLGHTIKLAALDEIFAAATGAAGSDDFSDTQKKMLHRAALAMRRLDTGPSAYIQMFHSSLG